MEFKEFINAIVDEIPEYLLQYEIDKVHIEEVKKNNGVTYTGLIIAVKDENISPNIYLNHYYSLYNNGYSVEKILSMIADEYKDAKERIHEKNIAIAIDDSLKEKVFIKIVNYDRNKELLKDCPYIMFHDLAITFRYLVSISEDGISSAALKNAELKRLGVDIDELYEIAKENTLRLFPPTLEKLEKIIKEKLNEDIDNCGDNNLYILTNEQGINGATYMIYEDIINEFAQKHDTDFYILPSSIHEILLLPAEDNMIKEELMEMVQEINNYVVSDLDYLSDNVYYFERSIGKIIL